MRTEQATSSRGWLVVAAGIAIVLVAGFLPWLRSGRAWRNSYELVRTADRLGLVGSGFQHILAVSWYLVPLLCGLTLAAVALDHRRVALVGAAVVVALAGVMVVVTVRASLPHGRGPVVAGAGALLSIAGSVVAAADRRSPGGGGAIAREELQPSVTRTGGSWRRSGR